MQIDRSTAIPFYHQLKQILLQQIRHGELRPGQRLPTERELQERYELSRTTVRQAINELVGEGVLHRERGRGTFISKPKVRHGPQRPFGLSAGAKPGWKVLGVHTVLPPDKVAKQLELAKGEEALRIERLRLSDGEPIGLHRAYVPASLQLEFTERELVEGNSSLSYLAGKQGLSFSESHRVIQAVTSTSGRECKLLKTTKGAALLLVERTTISAQGKPVEFLRAIYRGDRFEYYIHFEL